MKRNVILFLILAAFSTVVLSSYKKSVAYAVSHGAGGTTSSSPKVLTGMHIGTNTVFSPSGCDASAGGFSTGCHTVAATGTLSVTHALYYDVAMTQPVLNSGFMPGHAYKIKINAVLAGTGIHPNDTAFGFQTVIYGWRIGSTVPYVPGSVDPTHGLVPLNVDTTVSCIITEQAITAMHNVSSDVTKHSFQMYFEWIAPDATADIDSIRIATLFCAVDSDGTSSGDAFGWPAGDMTLHNSVKGAVGQMFKNAGFSIFPNPTTGNVNLKLTNIDEGQYVLYVYSLNGSRMVNRMINVVGNSHTENINLSSMPAGMYQVQLGRYGVYQTMPVIKQ